MELNIQEDKHEIFIKSTIWNTIIEVFKTEKNIDITKYMISIRIKWKVVLVKTNKPIINTEALMLDDKIKELCLDKIKKLGIKFYDFELKYI
jgi:hypothetical protein